MKITNYKEKLNFLNLGQTSDFLDIRAIGSVEPDENYKNGDIPFGYALVEFIIDGQAKILCGDSVVTVRRGELVIIYPDVHSVEYECSTQYPLKKEWLQIRGRYFDSLRYLYNIQDELTVKTSSECYPIMKSIVDFISKFGIHENKLCHMIFDLFDTAFGNERDKFEVPLCEQIRCVLDRHLEKPVKVSDVASYFCRSARHIERVFYEAFGVTVYKYLLERRFAAACRELRTSNELIYVIAQRFQLGGPGNFACEFKKRFCMTPSEYRERFKNSNVLNDSDVKFETVYDYIPYRGERRD